MGKWTRRAFITAGVLSGGALVLGVAIRPGNRAGKVQGKMAKDGERMLNVWLKIAPDNSITVIVPHAEMGQGTHTTLPMMLADEMDADWTKVHMMEAPSNKEYANYALAKGFILGAKDIPSFLVDTVDGVFLTVTKKMGMQMTGGSSSVRITGMLAMRIAGAAAKAVLLQAAADLWAVPIAELEAKNSIISHKASNRSEPFIKFAPQAVKLSQPAKPTLKKPEEFTVMGTSKPRLDLPGKVDGTARFGIDVSLPGMKYAAIKAAPVFGALVNSIDDSEIVHMKGVHKIVELDHAVAVIADGYWIAKTALDKLKVTFKDNGYETVGQDDIYTKYNRDLNASLAAGEDEKDVEKGDVEAVLKNAGQVVQSEYQVPYLAHATMEPMNCTAHVTSDNCEVWVGCQNPLGFAHSIAEVLELEPEQVQVHNQYLGGGFGRRFVDDVAKQAVQIAKEVDYPVKLIWSREEDMQHDFYREANISRFKAVLDQEGKILAWNNRFLFKHDPAEAPHIPYNVANQSIRYGQSETHIPWGYWRSVDSSMHAFFTESFMDELAHQAKMDPFEFRRSQLSNAPRFLKVLELAAEKSDWGSALPANWGRGISIHKCFGTIVAQVVEIEVIADGVKVHRVVCAADPGFAFHPNGFEAQMESGIIYGLTAALYGEITIDKGAVVQSNFHDYQMVRMNESPKIETYIINSGHYPGGAGEPSTPGIAPALANAIFDATGQRIRQLPIKNHKLIPSEKILG